MLVNTRFKISCGNSVGDGFKYYSTTELCRHCKISGAIYSKTTHNFFMNNYQLTVTYHIKKTDADLRDREYVKKCGTYYKNHNY